jgi:hypothetical protein
MSKTVTLANIFHSAHGLPLIFVVRSQWTDARGSPLFEASGTHKSAINAFSRQVNEVLADGTLEILLQQLRILLIIG